MLILSIGCKTSYRPVKTEFASVQVKTIKDTVGYSLTEKFLQPYRQKLQDSFSTVIATTTAKLVKKRPGGSLGNLVTASLWEFIKKNSTSSSQAPAPQFILMNYGGIRLKEINEGKLTIQSIYELLPFENTLVRVQITGAELKNLLQQLNKIGGWPMKFNTKKYSELKDIQDRMRFELITNNYIAQGGDNCTILKKLPQEDTGVLLRDIVINYLRKHKTITPDNQEYILN